ncbi:DUF885 domain-containing protein [Peterkaempfera sp. SMS 1(5)a]
MTSATPRQTADAFVDAYIDLDPIAATVYGLRPGEERLPDFSPDGAQAVAELIRRTLTELDTAAQDDPAERRCGRLLKERLTADLAVHEAGEGLRAVSSLRSPVQSIRQALGLMPTGTEADWEARARRMGRVPAALHGYVASLAEGLKQQLPGGPMQVAAAIDQLDALLGGPAGTSWFEDLAASGPDSLRSELEAGARSATEAVADLREWLRTVYGPGVEGAPETVGRERYLSWARYWTGADLDPDEAYAYGWSEVHRIQAEMREAAELVLPGSTALEAMHHLEEHGEAVEGTEGIRAWLQSLTDTAIDTLNGTYFELAEQITRTETLIAPPGCGSVPFYTQPSIDFSRPGRTWLPVEPGRTSFPVWNLVSTWYHEGVPGHHLQYAQWMVMADRLSTYQATLGAVSANVEGWALYAERLMDEFGHLTDPARRLGYLNGQMLRAVRLVVDIGMHLELGIPAGAGFHPGERWTPGLGREFLGACTGLPATALDSEHTRYLGLPGQAIGYKLGERVWLEGRRAAQGVHGGSFDLKRWHMAALSQGPLGLDDLAAELSML